VAVALVVAIEAQMQRRTKHEIYKHQRNMEQVRLAGRMRRYINSALMRNGALGLSPDLSVSVCTSCCCWCCVLQVNRWWMRMVSW
jgi:hypothetical protein